MVYRKKALDLNINLKISVDKDTRAKRSTGLINQTLLDNETSAVLSVSSILLHRRHQMHERLELLLTLAQRRPKSWSGRMSHSLLLQRTMQSWS